MRKSRATSHVIFLILSLLPLLLIVEPAVGAGHLLWQFSPRSSAIVTTQVIDDVSGDGQDDVLVATNAITRYSNYGVEELPAELIILDGKSGKLNRSKTLGMTSVGGAIFVNGSIISSIGKTLAIYDPDLQETYSETFNESPRLMGILSESQVVFSLNRNVTLFDLETRENLWTWTSPAQVAGMLIMEDALIVNYPEHLVMLAYNGTPISGKYVPRRTFGSATLYTESLHKLDRSRFLYLEDAWVILGQSPDPSLSMWEIDPLTFKLKWEIDVGGGAANKPHAISDIDSDGVNDFICRRKEDYRIAVLSGKTGEQIYPTGLSGYYVHASTQISDIDEDGIAEVAVNPYDENWWHGLYIISFKGNRSISYEIGFTLYSHLVAIPDIDDDSLLDIIAATQGGTIEAYRGFDSRFLPDVTPPTVSITSPANKTYIERNIPLTFSLNELAVNTFYSLDGQTNTTIDGKTTLLGLAEGAHSIVLYAEDSAGNVGRSNRVCFTVDTKHPTIQISSPENKTYTTRLVLLDFSVNEPVSWIGYSIDGKATATLTRPVTLFELSEGPHMLIVYARDVAGNDANARKVYFTVDSIPPTITVQSPQNTTYKTTSVRLSFNVDEKTSWIGYSIDDEADTMLTGNATLLKLAQGPHRLIIYAKDVAGNAAKTEEIHFSVDSAPPNIEIKSPQNTTYTTTSIHLNFTVNEPTAWISYSIDKQANVTITQNTILSALSEGPHTIIIYAQDVVGNKIASSEIHFSVNVERTQETPQTLFLIALAALAIIAITAVLAVVLRTRRTPLNRRKKTAFQVSLVRNDLQRDLESSCLGALSAE
jgi:hypothetical protein